LIPGKKYAPEDFLEIAWRRRWVVVIPFVLIAVGTFIWSQTLPNRYRSRAVVLVVAPQVPLNFVKPTVTEPLQKRLDSMQQEILSYARLEALIQEFELYPDLRQQTIMDEVVAQMRRDISVTPGRAARRQEPTSFEVSFDYDNPRTAMVVADRLASLFVQRNAETRVVQADSTTQFLEDQLGAARQKLQDHEAKLEAFRRANAGRLPTEVQSNIQMMQSAQNDLQALNAAINTDRDRQLVIQRTISDEIALASITRSANPAAPGGAEDGSAAAQLSNAEAQLAALSLRLKDTHPDIRNLKRRIEELKRAAADEALQRPVSDGAPVASTDPAEIARQKRIAGLRAEHESLERRIESSRQQAAQLQAAVANYRARLEAAPTLESEQTQLMRDYETLNEAYSTLLLKSQEAKVAANLEERQVGELFRIIDGARMPEKPTSPNRIRLNIIGALMGLGLGLGLAGVLEYKDRSIRTEDDVVLTLALPVLALVPTMMTRTERDKRKRQRMLLASSGAAVALVALAVVAWKFQVLPPFMR
jgi:polysaccharide chain length determinant protein (PEP-CTERM system associated)